MTGWLFHLLFYHRIQSLNIDYFLTPNTLINILPNRNWACKVSDLGTDYLLIVRRLKVTNEPLDHFVFHHGRKHLDGLLVPPLGLLIERFPTLLFCPLKNCAVGSYLNIELVILQEFIGHLSPI